MNVAKHLPADSATVAASWYFSFPLATYFHFARTLRRNRRAVAFAERGYFVGRAISAIIELIVGFPLKGGCTSRQDIRKRRMIPTVTMLIRERRHTMDLLRRKTPEEKAAEQAAREAQKAAQVAATEAQRLAEERRKALEAERARRISAANNAISEFYVQQAPKWEYLSLSISVEENDMVITSGGKKHPGSELENIMDDLGSRGWELTGIASWVDTTKRRMETWTVTYTVSQALFFKRPQPPLPPELAKNLIDAESYK